MTDLIQSKLVWIGLGLGVVAVFAALEMLLRGLTTKFGTPQPN